MRKDMLFTVVLSALVTLLALAPVGYMAYRALPPHVATVDLQKLVEDHQAQAIEVLGKGNPTNDEQRQAMEKGTIEFAKNLSAAVEALGAECDCVLLNKAAILSGVTTDYTDAVRERMKR